MDPKDSDTMVTRFWILGEPAGTGDLEEPEEPCEPGILRFTRGYSQDEDEDKDGRDCDADGVDGR